MRNWIVFSGMSLFTMASAFAGEGHVGEIRYSILELEQFQTLYGPEWELMKGQDVPADSELRHHWGNKPIPDARGLFLRGCNHGRDDKLENPDNTRLGGTQDDAFKKHKHGGGNHDHGPADGFSHFTCNSGRPDNLNAGGGSSNHGTRRTGKSGEIIAAEGGNETRPKSLTVNIFIKVRESVETTPAPASQGLTPEMLRQVMNSPEFKTAVEKTFNEKLDRGQ